MTPAELAADLRTRINPRYADQRGCESYLNRLCAEAIEGLLAELAALSLDLHTETAAVIALRTELIEIKAQFEMALEREVYWNSRWVLVSDQLASIKGQEPVAEIVGDESGYLSTNWNPEWCPNHGDKLYLAAGAQTIPAGYQLVPVEPTQAMVLAAKPWLKHYGLMKTVDKENASVEAYKAMLAAAKEQS